MGFRHVIADSNWINQAISCVPIAKIFPVGRPNQVINLIANGLLSLNDLLRQLQYIDDALLFGERGEWDFYS